MTAKLTDCAKHAYILSTPAPTGEYGPPGARPTRARRFARFARLARFARFARLRAASRGSRASRGFARFAPLRALRAASRGFARLAPLCALRAASRGFARLRTPRALRAASRASRALHALRAGFGRARSARTLRTLRVRARARGLRALRAGFARLLRARARASRGLGASPGRIILRPAPPSFLVTDTVLRMHSWHRLKSRPAGLCCSPLHFRKRRLHPGSTRCAQLLNGIVMHTLQDPGFVLAVVESVIILAVCVALNGVGRHAHTSGSAPRSGCHRSRKCLHPGSTCRTKRRRHAYTSGPGLRRWQRAFLRPFLRKLCLLRMAWSSRWVLCLSGAREPLRLF